VVKRALSQKKNAEYEREKSRILLDRRDPLPKKKDRPPSPIKKELEPKDLDTLVQLAKNAIEEVSERTNARATGKACKITTDQIVIDPRVRWKCIIPVCFGYNSSPCCPPNSPNTEEMREIVSQYKHAILIRYEPKAKDHVYPAFLTSTVQHVNELNEIVSIVEVEACYLGYYLAMGFKGGPCTACGIFSPEYVSDWIMGKAIPTCPVLEGKMCDQWLRARPALEACSVDVFATARNAGWEEPYVIMPEHPKTSVPCVSWHGIVLII
jgi:predicted metal-binding protein